MMYGLKAAGPKQVEEKKLDFTKIKMLRWRSGVTQFDRIGNEYIRGSVKVVDISKKNAGGKSEIV